MPLQVTDLTNEEITAEFLAQQIIGRGIEVSNARFIGNEQAAGTFNDSFDINNSESRVLREGYTQLFDLEIETDSVEIPALNNDGSVRENAETQEDIIETVEIIRFADLNLGIPIFTAEEDFQLTDTIQDGVIFSTGNANEIGTANLTQFLESTSFGLEGDAQLESAVSPEQTRDAFVLEFDFVPDLEIFSFRISFASEEYSQFDNRQFNDSFAFFLDGPSQDGSDFNNENIAVITDPVDGTNLPISVNSLFNVLNFEPPTVSNTPTDENRGDNDNGNIRLPIILDNTLDNEEQRDFANAGAFFDADQPQIPGLLDGLNHLDDILNIEDEENGDRITTIFDLGIIGRILLVDNRGSTLNPITLRNLLNIEHDRGIFINPGDVNLNGEQLSTILDTEALQTIIDNAQKINDALNGIISTNSDEEQDQDPDDPDPFDPFRDPDEEEREFLIDNAVIQGQALHDFEFNQFTTILDVRTDTLIDPDSDETKLLIPGETYTARLVIADNFDDIVDSAVFIEDQDQTRFRREQLPSTNPLFIDLDQVVAVRDIANARSNEPIIIDVLANDVDPQRDPLNIDLDFSTPLLFEFDTVTEAGGTVRRDDNGTNNLRDDRLIYTPPSNFNGVDRFSYTITDDTSLSGAPFSTDEAEVSINVFREVPIMVEEEDNLFALTQDPNVPIQGEFQLTFAIDSRSANNVNEIGLVLVDDLQGTINGLEPGDPGYLATAINRSQVVFSSLTQRAMVEVNTTRRFNFEPGDFIMPFLVQDDSIDSVEEKLATGAELPNIFFAIPEANADGFNHLQVEETNRIFELEWEDMFGGGDQDFNDFRMTLQLTDEAEAPGTNLQGDIELIDLREFSSLEAQFLVQSDANYQNTVGFYQVEDESGTISTFDTNGIATSFSPGDVGYARAAVENAIVSFDRNGTDNTSLSGLVAPFIITNATTEQFLLDNPRNLRGREPLAFFPFLDANPDGFDHIRLLGDNTFGFEDLPDGGDFDFEDMIVEVDFV